MGDILEAMRGRERLTKERIATAVAIERELCAQLADKHNCEWGDPHSSAIAAAIRARE